MSRTASLSRADIAHLRDRLMRELSVEKGQAEAAIESAVSRGAVRVYDVAKADLQNFLQTERKRVEEARRTRERFLADQAELHLCYDMLIRPALIAWMGLLDRNFDPLRDPCDAACLYAFTLSRGYALHAYRLEREGEAWQGDETTYVTQIFSMDGWCRGEGEGHGADEALVLACYQIAKKEQGE